MILSLISNWQERQSLMNNSECFNNVTVFTNMMVSGLNMILGVSGIVVAGGVLMIMGFLKKHQLHTNRLVMYLNVGILIQGVVSALGFNSIIAGDDLSFYSSSYCSALGFLNNYAVLIQLVVIEWIMIDVFLKTALDLYTKKAFEIIQVCSAFLGPALILWIPLLPGIRAYGSHEGLCDIKLVNYTDCTRHNPGFIVSLVACLIQVVALAFSIFLYAITINKLKVEQKEKKCESVCQTHIQHEIDQLRKRTHRLLFYPVVFFIFSVPGWLDMFLHDSIPLLYVYFLLIIQVTCLNLRGIVISITFTFTTDICRTILKLTPTCVCRKCCRKTSSLNSATEAGFRSPYILDTTNTLKHKLSDSYKRGPKLQVHIV